MERLLPLGEVLNRLGVGRSTVYQLVKDGKLSRPAKPSAKKSCWPESEISDFIAARIKERDERGQA